MMRMRTSTPDGLHIRAAWRAKAAAWLADHDAAVLADGSVLACRRGLTLPVCEQTLGAERWAACRTGWTAEGVYEPRAIRQTARPAAGGGAVPARVRQRTIRERAMSLVRAVTGPRVDDAEYAKRLAICEAGACGHLRREGDAIYCGACGCGRWRLAELRTKLWFAALACPCDPPWWGDQDGL